MKKKIKVYQGKEKKEKYITTIPLRFVFAMLLIVAEFLAVIAIMVQLSLYSQAFVVAEFLTQIGCVISIISRNDNPDYKAPWLLVILVVPVAGFMAYLMFYSRKLSTRQLKKLRKAEKEKFKTQDDFILGSLKNAQAKAQATFLYNTANAPIYNNTKVKYFAQGEDYFYSLLDDLKQAKEFIFLEYFIIERGHLWNSLLDVLTLKAKEGVEVRVLYDDIGCMGTLPGNYDKKLKKLGINCAIFSRLRGQVNNEFNNRNHRKIAVIDGKVGYTGGLNLADEYINQIKRFGHWKDVGVRLEGEAVNELTATFILDYDVSAKKSNLLAGDYFRKQSVTAEGYVIPFSDGPRPIFNHQVSKRAIINMLGSAKKYVYMTSPYLIIDSELSQAIESAALRGVDVRIITPHVPDKKLVFKLTRSTYKPLIRAGVKIYEYAPGFIHAKTYLSDDETAIVGTVNLDYRSLVHHFENCVWLHRVDAIKDIKKDILSTIDRSIEIDENQFVGGPLKRFFIATLKVFTPLL